MSSAAPRPERIADSTKPASAARLWGLYALNLAAVYGVVYTTTLGLALRVYKVLPLFRPETPLEFVFSNLFLFSFFPALLVGFAYAQWYPHRVALFVWAIPFVILAYQFLTFPTPLDPGDFRAPFHEYFGGGFFIPQVHSYRELFALDDMRRGMLQLTVTAPVYAGVGYSIGAFLGINYDIPRLTATWRKLKPTLSPSK